MLFAIVYRTPYHMLSHLAIIFLSVRVLAALVP